MFPGEWNLARHQSDSDNSSPHLAPLPESDSSTSSIELDSQSFRDRPINRHLTQGYIFPYSSTDNQSTQFQEFGLTSESAEGSYSLSSNLQDLSSDQSKKSSPSPPKP